MPAVDLRESPLGGFQLCSSDTIRASCVGTTPSPTPANMSRPSELMCERASPGNWTNASVDSFVFRSSDFRNTKQCPSSLLHRSTSWSFSGLALPVSYRLESMYL